VTRVVVFGAHGMLGQDLVAAAPREATLTPLDRECDVTDGAAVQRTVEEAEAEVVINCAAYTAVDRAEEEPEAARMVNARAPETIGEVARTRGALVVHYSTDYVFDGRATRPYREEDPPAPLGVYARTKLEGERALAASGARSIIIRTSWLFGRHGKSFPRTMWERAMAGHATRVVNDQRGRPTFTVDLAQATWRLVTDQLPMPEPQTQTFHVANQGIATWYELARYVFDAAGRPELLSTCTSAEYPTPAPRPAYSVLDTSCYEALVGTPLPPWQDAADRFLDDLRRER
jgi:dTDP-4-dehydrorhamnose reductase